MALAAYITQTQSLLHDASAVFYPVSSIVSFINSARAQIAAEGECVRVLPTSSAGVASAAVLTGGTGYTIAFVTFSPPPLGGTTATGTCTVGGGAVTAVNISTNGSGYLMPPSATITGNGSGATASTTLQPANQTVVSQEVYTFATANAFLPAGVTSILSVKSIAVPWGSLKPTLRWLDWGSFQAYLRSYSVGLQNFPQVWSQFGQGTLGSIYLWPIPSQVLGMDWDAACLPMVLTSDADPELIPYPWTDCVGFYAAYLALLNAQRQADADQMFKRYMMYMLRARTFQAPSMVPDFYDRSPMRTWW
jgi:hypothetical protein